MTKKLSINDIANELGVAKSTVSFIIRTDNWFVELNSPVAEQAPEDLLPH